MEFSFFFDFVINLTTFPKFFTISMFADQLQGGADSCSLHWGRPGHQNHHHNHQNYFHLNIHHGHHHNRVRYFLHTLCSQQLFDQANYVVVGEHDVQAQDGERRVGLHHCWAHLIIIWFDNHCSSGSSLPGPSAPKLQLRQCRLWLLRPQALWGTPVSGLGIWEAPQERERE